jgi:mannose-6-phosphate isomerase
MEIGERPWGKYFVLEETAFFKVKRIEVSSGKQLSYQYHNYRSEIWTIVQGDARVVLEGEQIFLQNGDVIKIPIGAKHRIANEGIEKLIFIEVQLGSYFGEDDIIRLEDDFNRAI